MITNEAAGDLRSAGVVVEAQEKVDVDRYRCLRSKGWSLALFYLSQLCLRR